MADQQQQQQQQEQQPSEAVLVQSGSEGNEQQPPSSEPVVDDDVDTDFVAEEGQQGEEEGEGGEEEEEEEGDGSSSGGGGGGKPSGPEKHNNSRSAKAGLVLPVSRVEKRLRDSHTGKMRISESSLIVLTSYVENIIRDLLTECITNVIEQDAKRLTPRTMVLAPRKDKDLSAFMRNYIIPKAGCLPYNTNTAADIPRKPKGQSKAKKAGAGAGAGGSTKKGAKGKKASGGKSVESSA
jgi:hypothetical protein